MVKIEKVRVQTVVPPSAPCAVERGRRPTEVSSPDTGATWGALTEGLSTTGGASFPASNALVALASDDVYVVRVTVETFAAARRVTLVH